MKKNRGPRNRGSNEDSEENLRGKVRELTKRLELEKRYRRSLEKRLHKLLNSEPVDFTLEDDEDDIPASALQPPKLNDCNNCGKDGDVKEVSVWSPSGEMVFLVCQVCDHRERKK